MQFGRFERAIGLVILGVTTAAAAVLWFAVSANGPDRGGGRHPRMTSPIAQPNLKLHLNFPCFVVFSSTDGYDETEFRDISVAVSSARAPRRPSEREDDERDP